MFWTDGNLVHVAYAGVLRFESFCSMVPLFGMTEKCDGPATCLECTSNEGRPRPWSR